MRNTDNKQIEEQINRQLAIFIPAILITLLVIMVILLSIGGYFANSDQKARSLYNEALITWSKENQLQSLKLLDQVVALYPETEAASEAILRRQEYDKIYATQFSQEINESKNNHNFAKAVYESIMLYKQNHGVAPKNLMETKIGQIKELEPFLSFCSYRLSPRNQYDFALDCQEALKYQEETGKYNQYTDYKNKNPNPETLSTESK